MPVGADGAVGGAWAPAVNTTVDISQTVFGPVPTVAAGVDPAPTTWSSDKSSMAPLLEMLVRAVYPEPAVRVSSKPESE